MARRAIGERGNTLVPDTGRPRTPMATVNLVLLMAEENLGWGHRKIAGELRTPGIHIGTTTVR